MKHWKKSKTLTNAEMVVLCRLLPPDDVRSKLLLKQATDASEIRRQLLGNNGYKLTIPYVKDDASLIDVDNDLVSPQLLVIDSDSGRRLSFSVRVLRGGFLNDLTGIAEDGLDWPLNWRISDSDLLETDKRNTMNWLPPAMKLSDRHVILTNIAEWCGIDAQLIQKCPTSLLEIQKPATLKDIIAAEMRLHIKLPPTYHDFVKIVNGISVRQERIRNIFGTSDIYGINYIGKEFAVLTDLHEDGVVALNTNTDSEEQVVLLLGPFSKPSKVIGSLRTYVHDIVWSVCS